MTKETLDYQQLTGAVPPQELAIESDGPEYSDLAETMANMPVESDDEQALEQYMNSMLERLTGGKKAAPAVTQPLEPIDAVVEAAPVEPSTPVRERVRPSDVREDLSGMRELANQNVESALGVHTSGRLVQRIKLTLFTAMGFSLTSSLILVLTYNTSLSWSYSAALAGMGAALLASFRYVGLSRRLAKIHRQLNVRSE